MEQFSEMVKAHMEQHFGDGYQIRVWKVRKNNGCYRTGLNIMKEGKDAVPTIYLDFYLEEFRNGRDLGEIYLDIISEYERHRDDVSFDRTILTEFEKARERICLKLINLEKNSEMLEETPHVVFQDLAAVFYIHLPEVGENSAAAISNRMVERWKPDVDVEELYSLALQNTQRIFREEIFSMEDFTADILKDMPEDVQSIYIIKTTEETSMFVATNTAKINGAAVILYPRVLKDFADRKGRDFYILPSSVHETILIPADDEKQIQELAAMVKRVNETRVQPEEVLSDSVYLYSRQKDSITICSQ